jgi:hypothetical protein
MSASAPILAGREPLEDLQRAVCVTLAELLDPIKVYDFVPEQGDPPYVTWGTAWLAERDTLNGTADRVWFQLDIWSSYRGYREAAEIASAIIERLHHAVLDIDGWDRIHLLREQSHATRDPDGKHRRIALTFHSPYVSPTGGIGHVHHRTDATRR